LLGGCFSKWALPSPGLWGGIGGLIMINIIVVIMVIMIVIIIIMDGLHGGRLLLEDGSS
jgi:hypothetical protein